MQEERERLLAVLERTRLPFWIWRLAECLRPAAVMSLINVVMLSAISAFRCHGAHAESCYAPIHLASETSNSNSSM